MKKRWDFDRTSILGLARISEKFCLDFSSSNEELRRVPPWSEVIR